MVKNKKDYLAKTLLLQFIVCLVLFGLLFILKSSNNKLFTSLEDAFSEKLEENLKIEQAQQVFSNILNNQKKDIEEKETESETKKDIIEEETKYIPLEEPSLSAEIIATGGNDVKVSSENEIPKSVSVNNYKLSKQMVLPLRGNITSEFGVRTHPISGDLRFHSGIDIAAKEGSNIYAAFDGVITEATYDKWNGNYLKIKHDNNIMTVYCHCQELNVKKGDKIRAGEIIATVGSTGSSTGPHLHFELRVNNISYNPQKALDEAINEF